MSKHTKERQVHVTERHNGTPTVTATETETHVFSIVPLPSAAEFAAFEDAVPGTGERILTLFEKQFEHRCQQETKQQENDHSVRMSGIAVGFLVIVIFAVLAVVFALGGRQTEAIVAIVAPMVGFALASLKYTTPKRR